MSEEIKKSPRGMNMDFSLENQPKGTYRYALNMVNETEKGDLFNNSSEGSTSFVSALSTGERCIGKVTMNNSTTAVFVVKDRASSSDTYKSTIRVLDKDGKEITADRITTSNIKEEKTLNFKITHQVDAVFRLRKGGQRVILLGRWR